MSHSSPNHYRVLYVQPDAPPEVIKAAWRALMSARRVHPDLGGSHDEAVRLNAAYEVLGDAARRAAYDHSLRQPPTRSTRPPAAATSPHQPPRASPAANACPFCGQPHSGALRRDSRCSACDSPLTPLPERQQRASQDDAAPGRRQAPRYDRDAAVQLWLPGERQPRSAQLRDLSFTGLQLHAADALAPGQVARVVAPWFDALFTVVGCRSLRSGCALHGRLLTLLLQQQARGVYVSERA